MKKHFLTLVLILISSQIFAQKFNTEQEFINYFSTNCNTLDPIEGIWLVQFSKSLDNRNYKIADYYKAAIIKDGSKYIEYPLKDGFVSSNNNFIKFNKSYSTTYTVYNYNIMSQYTATKSATISDNTFEFVLSLEDLSGERSSYTFYTKRRFSKSFPLNCNEINNSNKNNNSTGTGFAISSDGYIVTNYHVIENATKIKVKGIKGDFSKSYSAKVIVSDKNNDLAILKIDDYSFTTLGTIPYMIKNNSANVGENIFVLGYPLTATMGEEIKLTNGIISSKSGFQGDITSYQMTAPIQPGNSGAPMFDKDGNIVGIVNAKHVGAENAGYAVKTSYLFNLIDALPTTLKLPSVNTLKGKTLSSQVELANKFVYIIEVN